MSSILEDEKYVFDNALIKCTCGSAKEKLKILDNNRFKSGSLNKRVTTEKDCVQGKNFRTFGLCTRAGICMTNIEITGKWENTHDIKVNGMRPLQTKSFLKCKKGGYLLIIDNGQMEKNDNSLMKTLIFGLGAGKIFLGSLGIKNGLESIAGSEGNGFVVLFGISTTISSADLTGSGIIDIWNVFSDNLEDGGTYPLVDAVGTLGGSIGGKFGRFFDQEDTWEQYGILIGRGSMNTFEFLSLAGGLKELGKGIPRSMEELKFVFNFNKKQHGVLKAIGEATFEGITENGLGTKLAAQGSDLKAGVTMLLTEIEFEELETINKIKEIKEYEVNDKN